MYLRIRGCPVVLDIELSVSAWYQKTRRAQLRARCLVLLLRERRCAVCGITLKISSNGAETKERFCANQNTMESRRVQNTSTSKNFYLFMETPCMDLRVGPTRKVIRRTCPVCNRQSTHAPPRRGPRGQNTCVCIPHADVYRSVLSREQTRLALSKLEKTSCLWKSASLVPALLLLRRLYSF